MKKKNHKKFIFNLSLVNCITSFLVLSLCVKVSYVHFLYTMYSETEKFPFKKSPRYNDSTPTSYL